jgi:hypothetical protein
VIGYAVGWTRGDETVRRLTFVKAAVASLVFTSSAAVWANPPQYLYGTSTSGLAAGPIAVTTTVPTTKNPYAAFVVAAEANASGDLEVIAWHDTTTSLVLAGTPAVEEVPTLIDVAVTGLDAKRVVTAGVDSTGALSIDTWVIGGTAGVVKQNGYSTGGNVAYHSVSIATLTATKVVTAVRDTNGNLAVEAWTINADGLPTAETLIGAGPTASQVTIAASSVNRVVTAVNDTDNSLWVTTWGVDGTGVHYQDQVEKTNKVSRVSEDVSIAAGSVFRLTGGHAELIEGAFTPIITKSGNVEVLYWEVSKGGKLTLQSTPVSTTTDDFFEVAACMLPGNVPITIDADVNSKVNLGWYRNGPGANYTAIKGNTNGITSIAATTAGSDFNVATPYSQYNAYFVTAVLTYSGGSDIGKVEIRKWSYPVEPVL